MRIALTGATGFLGRYLLAQFAAEQHTVRAWRRPESNLGGLEHVERHLEWVGGAALGNFESCRELVKGCDVLVHAALARLDFTTFNFGAAMALSNFAASMQLFEAAKAAGAKRIVFISSCAVYGKILAGAPLDETHPLWPDTHYGAHKAAVEAFVHSYAQAEKCTICALRPTAIYGLAYPVEKSKWYDLVSGVVRNEVVSCSRGSKHVHAADVARATSLLIHADADRVAGEAFNCVDLYISEYDVAHRAKAAAGGHGEIIGEPMRPKNQIETGKLRALGFEFGGQDLLDKTIRDMIGVARISGGAVT
jgi:nucleoside-diphosphate-sugar epimerase